MADRGFEFLPEGYVDALLRVGYPEDFALAVAEFVNDALSIEFIHVDDVTPQSVYIHTITQLRDLGQPEDLINAVVNELSLILGTPPQTALPWTPPEEEPEYYTLGTDPAIIDGVSFPWVPRIFQEVLQEFGFDATTIRILIDGVSVYLALRYDRPEDVHPEDILTAIDVTMTDHGYPYSVIFEILSRVRVEVSPPAPDPESPLDILARSKLAQFLMTPIELAAKLPQAVLNDLEDWSNQDRKRKLIVQLPGWEDVFHITPDPPITEAERKAWRAWRRRAAKEGFERLGFNLIRIREAERVVGPIPLTIDQLMVMRKKWELVRRLRGSPTPETLRVIGSILTWFDDINDALVTLGYLVRVGLRGLKYLAPRVALKFVPVLGWVTLFRDAFDVFSYFRVLRLARSDGKRKWWDALEMIPRLARNRGRRQLKMMGILPTFRELIQILQTTDVLWGVGVSLGPIVGFLEDALFGLYRGAKFRFMDWEFRIATTETLWQNLLVQAITSPRLTPASFQAMRTLKKSSLLLRHGPDLTPYHFLLALTAHHIATRYLEETQDIQDYDRWAKPFLDIPLQPQPVNDLSKLVLEEFPDYEIRDQEEWPFLGGLPEITPRLMSSLLLKDIPRSIDQVLSRQKRSIQTRYAMSIISEDAKRIIRAYEGKDDVIESHLSPEARAWYLYAEYGFADEFSDRPDLEQLIISQIADFLIRRQHRSPTYQEVKSLVELFQHLR